MSSVVCTKATGLHLFKISIACLACFAPNQSIKSTSSRVFRHRIEHSQAAEAEEEPMEPGQCEIARLPEEILSAALSRTSPRDACRAAAVSPAFRAAADSDAVWACFLPPPADLPPLADGELLLPPRGKKGLFLRLSGSPALLPGGLSMWLDRESGAKCYMVPARDLSIAWRDTPRYWTSWIHLADSRFPESAQLRFVCWLEIRGRIHSKMLSRGSAYANYMVYKLDDESYGLDWPADASVSIGGTDLARKVCLQPNPQRSHAEDVVLPRERGDGWMELELGEFVCEGDEDGDVSFGLAETKRLNGKGGLIMQGIEIRHKN
ncbi:hypothetical protein CFC21_051217 [Triticum aestivum]|uniref:F-box domain-containing protein n=2 Tax=Triticum aestivum TaxID=4565 RepID=A0A9R1K5D8_WHEAT|nr:F-box protein PP2-B10-like [Triticum aestivum]KAF7041420.1 hypothetical protein CFC21_051217 [Triticum aestivum]